MSPIYVPLPTPPPGPLQQFLEANQNLTTRLHSVGPGSPQVIPWNPDLPIPVAEGNTFQFIAGPDRCGYPDRDKFFRGFRFFGTGVGSYLAFVDGNLVQSGTLDGAAGALGNVASFPRGTAGREVLVVGSFGGVFDHLEFLHDPIGLLEDA